MTNNVSKTVSTVAIWAATAAIYILGICRMTGDGFLMVLMTIAVAAGSSGATAVVWLSESRAIAADDRVARKPEPTGALLPASPAGAPTTREGITTRPGG